MESFLDVSELPDKVVDDKFRQDAIEMTIPLGERGGAGLLAVDTVGALPVLLSHSLRE